MQQYPETEQSADVCHDGEYALLVSMKSQTYIIIVAARCDVTHILSRQDVCVESRNILRRDTALQVLSWRGVDTGNGEHSQTRENSEEREMHCDQLRIGKLGVSLSA